MQILIRLCLFVVVLLASLSCRESSVSEFEEPQHLRRPGAIALVGRSWILESDLELFLSQNPGTDAAVAMERLVQEAALAEAAKEKGLDQSPHVRAAQRRLLSSKYLQGLELDSVPIPSEEELRERWQMQREKWTLPARARLACLLVKDEHSFETARAEFLALGPSPARRGFGALAARFSQEPNTRYQGGEFGWVERGRAHPILADEIIAAAFSQKKGLVEEPVRVSDSVWMVLVQEFEEERLKSFESAEEQIRWEWMAEKMREKKEEGIRQALETIEIERFGHQNGPVIEREGDWAPALPK